MLHEAVSKMPETFDSKVLLRGQDYFSKGQVLSIRLSEGLLKGRVKGSSGQIYDVHMDLKKWPLQASHCSCPYQVNCKHAAACLFAIHEKEKNPANANMANRLDRKLDMWLKNIRAQEESISTQTTVSHKVHYILNLNISDHTHSVEIKLSLAKLLKRGGFGKKITFHNLSDSKKQHFMEDDNEIVAQLLFKYGSSDWFRSFEIRNSELLSRIVNTGRAFFADDEETPIRLGDILEGSCHWSLLPNGDQSLILEHNNKPIDYLLLDESWYFDKNQSIMGVLKTPYPTAKLAHLLQVPPIPLDQAPLLVEKMAKTCPEFPVPQVFEQREIRKVTPTPVLIFNAILPNSNNYMGFVDEDLDDVLFTGQIFFDYGNVSISAEDRSDCAVVLEKGILVEYKRDKKFEKTKIEEAFEHVELRESYYEECDYFNLDDSFFVLEDEEGDLDLDFLYEESIPYLSNQGWRIEFASPLYQKTVSADEVEWYSDLQESTSDFFSYQLGILVEGQPVSIVPLVAKLINQYSSTTIDNLPDNELVTLPLEDGRALEVEMGRIKPLIRLLLQFGIRNIAENQQLQINKYQLMLMREAELAIAATKSRWQGAETVRKELKQLISATKLPSIKKPIGLIAELRDYQQHGLNWLQFLRKSRFSGILADDMGLGKTVQALAHLQYEKEQQRMTSATLIIAPTSLVGNWFAEAKRFTPNLRVLIYHGSNRHEDNFDDFDLVVSTYSLIHRDKDKFIDYSFYYLILDEAQFIKNSRTKTTQIIQQLQASHRLCLTGTPLENHLGELWSLFHFLMPGLLGDAKQFRSWFRTPIEKNSDSERRVLLAKRVKPFMLRRTKNQVATELPPKTEMMRKIEIIGPQRDLYEAIRMSMEKKVRDAIAKQGLGKSHILLLDALLKLRQVCCDPRLLSLPEATIAHGTSSKLETLMELLDNLVDEGRRVLVFSQFTSMLKLIEEQLINKHYPYLKLTGQTQNRQALVDTFQEGTIPIFLISLKAGGTGLNLTRADTVIHYDPWWNPAVEDQATDRIYRIGQENPVFVYKLITSGTVEEAILEMQERKRQLVGGVLSEDNAQTMALSEEDLEKFFTPLG